MRNIYGSPAGQLRAEKKRRKIVLAIFAPLCVAAMLLSLTLILRPAFTDTGDGWDLNNFTTGVVLKNSGGTVIPPGSEVIAGNDYILSISFKEKSNLQFAYRLSDGMLVYQLPANITIETARTNQPIYGTGSPRPVIGRYSVTTGGLITVKFDNVWANGAGAGGNFIDIYTNAEFTIDIFAKFDGSSGMVNFNFGNNVKIDWSLKAPPVPEAVLRINKNSAAYNAATNSINYTVTLTAENGNLTISRISDWARRTGPNQNLGALPDPGYINLANVVVRNNGTVVPSSQYSIAWRAGSSPPIFDIDFNSPVTLQNGRSMTVTYTMNLADYIAANCDDGDFYFNVHNEATVTYKDPDNTTKTARDVHDVGVSRSLMSKSGSYNSTTGKITWTVTLGDGKANLAGVTITDTLGAGIEASARPSSVNMTLRTTNNGTPVWSGSVPTALGSGRTFTFQIPSDPSPVYYATITYTTDVNPNVNYPAGGQYTNDVSVNLPGGGKSSAGGGVYIGRSGKIEVAKSGRFLDETTVEWTLTVDVPGIFGPAANGGQGVPFYLVDWSEGDFGGDHEAENNPENIVVTVNGEMIAQGATPLRWRSIKDPALPSSWLMLFNNATVKTNSRWPYNEDVRLVITYTQDLSKARLVAAQTNKLIDVNGCTTLLEYIKSDPKNAVINTIVPLIDNPPVNPPPSEWDWAWLSWPVWKNNKAVTDSGNDTIFTYEVILNANETSIWWNGNKTIYKDKDQLFPAGGPAPFFDEFDDRLEYVPGSFTVELRSGNQSQIATQKPYWNTIRATYKYPAGQDVTVSGNTLSANLADLVRISGTNDGADWFTTNAYNIVIRYQMKLPDGKDILDQIILKNTAGIEAGGNKVTGRFTNGCEVKYGKKAVTKGMSADGNVATFSILVNPDGKKFVTPPDVNLLVTDKMNNTLSFYLTSIRVYTESVPKSGNFNVLRTEMAQTPALDPDALWTWALTDANEITLVLPDQTPIKIVYDALIRGNVGSTASIENYVEVTGGYYDEYVDRYTLLNTDASGKGSRSRLLLYKNDSKNTSVFLPGAKFALYIGWPTANNWNYGGTSVPAQYAAPGGTMPQTFTAGSMTFYYLDNKTTAGANGFILFDDPWLLPEWTAEG
ncbi:MAG: hypothetical protein FWE80_04130, partial [Oscillospiraceae bacterium]|nr:hypothetical protein [Oscillospiraceae bacterium]